MNRRSRAESPPDAAVLEASLGHRFADRTLLSQALVHRSGAHEAAARLASNERLEFLGDSVLDLVIAELLLVAAPDAHEGALSRWRAEMVSARFLEKVARRLDLGAHLVLGRGEERTGGRARRSLLADACEAVIGAVYLDAGLAGASGVIRSLWQDEVARAVRRAGNDPKSALQELLQGRGEETPQYAVIEAAGPAHARTYSVEVTGASGCLGRGKGASKQEAERAAAESALAALRIDGAADEPRPPKPA